MVRITLQIEARRFPPDIENFFVLLLREHDATVELYHTHIHISLPQGTTRYLRGVYMVHTTEYTHIFPDGFRLYESQPYYKRFKSGISFDLKDVPPAITQAHPRNLHNR